MINIYFFTTIERIMSERVIKTIRILLLALAFTPLAFSDIFFYPAATPKIFFARGIIQITVILSLALFAYLAFAERERLSRILKDFWVRVKKIPRIFLFFSGLFLLSQTISTILAENPHRAFWGTERGEGLFNLLNFSALFILLLFFWRKKEFKNYFRFSVIAGAIVYLYAFFQAIGFIEFPFAFPFDPRPGSFIGNPAFLASYALFVAICAVITIYFEKKSEGSKNKFWLKLSYAVLFLTPIVIFITKTRGALLGILITLFAGLVYFAFTKDVSLINKKLLKRWARIFLVSSVLISLVFVMTRGSSFWQSIPGLDRLAKTSFLKLDASSETRLLGWKLGLEAIKEKPIFGWGPEHYIFAFEKLYYPEFASNGETWLDKAHNKYIDVGVEQGVFGLFVYFGFIASLLSILLNKKHRTLWSSAIGIIFIGYLVQDFFLFDEINSYTSFFVLCAFVSLGFLSGNFNEEATTRNENNSKGNISRESYKTLFLGTGSAISAIFFIWLFFTTIAIPVRQTYYARKATTPKNPIEFSDFFNKATNPYNFMQYELRPYIFDAHYNGPNVFIDTRLKKIALKLVNTLEEVSIHEPFDVRLFVREAQGYNQLGKQESNLYEKGEYAIRKAIAIAPKRTDLYYTLAISLAGQMRYAEAIKVAETAVELNPNVARAYYHLALVSVAGSQKEKAAEAMRKLREIDPMLSRWSVWDFQGIILIYEQLNDTNNVISMVTDSAKGINAGRFEAGYYEKTLAYYAFKKDADNLIVVAEYIKDHFPERAEDMNVLIDLAKNGNWKIINSL